MRIMLGSPSYNYITDIDPYEIKQIKTEIVKTINKKLLLV